MRIAGIVKTSAVDGKGMRFTVFTQGCRHNCLGCHNPSTHDFNGGTEMHIKQIANQFRENARFLSGISLSGGDPMEQAKECIELLRELSDTLEKYKCNIWVYTGYTFEEILNGKNEDMKELLKMSDILVDGKFELSNKSLNLKFKGSSNQRIIDVKSSLLNNVVISMNF